MNDYAAARLNMVEGQIKPNKVTDRALLNAIATVPREIFVPKAARGVAYVDEDIKIGNGRYLIEPRVFARLVNEAAITRDDVVLDIACGSGYSTAVLARLASNVVAIESDPELARQATARLTTLGVANAVVIEAPLTQGYPAQAPYPVIVINGAVAAVPEAILGQLAEGGRLVAVIKRQGLMSCATLFKRTSGVISRRELFDAGTPLLPGFEPQPVFEF